MPGPQIMPAARFTSVDAYIAAAPEKARAKFEELRALIKAAVPKIEERIWYNVPFYWHGGEVVGLSVHKTHVSFGYGSGVLEERDRGALEAKGYKTGKGTFQIGFDQPLPTAMIKKILKTKIALNEKKPAK
jgi:uncharacterized protein YdhG (YjbR/CyaY superfamily)